MSNRYEIPSNGWGMNSRDLREFALSTNLLISQLKPEEQMLLPFFFRELSIEVIARYSGLPESRVKQLERQIKEKLRRRTR